MQGSWKFIQKITLSCIAVILMTVTPAYAVTTHSGVISVNTTWDNTDTHLVTGDITVTNNAILTISAGATVQFAALSDDTNSGNYFERTELIISSGKLVISGNSTSPVTLTSNASVPSGGDWTGVIVSSGGEVSIQFAIIEYANRGINYLKSGAVVGNPVIDDSIIRFISGHGLYVRANGGAQLNFLMRRNEIYNCQNGVDFYASNISPTNLTFDGNNIHNNSSEGIIVSVDEPGTITNLFKNNLIHSNGGNGVRLYHYAAGQAPYYMDFKNSFNLNSIYNNNGYGILSYTDHGLIITHNTIFNNSSGGLNLKDFTKSRISFNNIYGNGFTDITNGLGSVIDATYNWWGLTTTSELVAGTNPGLISGLVDYNNWLSTKQPEPFITNPQSWIKTPTQNETKNVNQYLITGSASYQGNIARVEVSVDNGISWATAVGTYDWSYNWNIPTSSSAISYQIRSRIVTTDNITESPKIGKTLTIDPNLPVTVTITSPTTILAGDTTYEGNDIIVDGTILTIDGSHTFNSLQLNNAATLTHSTAAASKLVITASSIDVDATSKIDVSSKGLVSSFTVGRTGGSYGGSGGAYQGATNATYGSIEQPTDFGTGGYGNYYGRSSRGGGSIKLIATELNLAGQILSQGQVAADNNQGGGSGGSIWLDVGVLTGSGLISANGGRSIYNAGGGGGGRVAVYYSDASGFDLATRIQNKGGLGHSNGPAGAAGTIYTKDKAVVLGAIRVENTGITLNGGYTDITAPMISASVTIVNAKAKLSGSISGDLNLTGATVSLLDGSSIVAVKGASSNVTAQGTLAATNNILMIDGSVSLNLSQPLTLTTLSLLNGATLTHSSAANATSSKVEITATTVTIDATSKIDVSSKGLVSSFTVGRTGGSYGGSGGAYQGATNATYGSIEQPTDFGTGGYGNYYGRSSRGGGSIKLIATELNLAGQILSQGQVAADNNQGGGSGGSIWLDVGVLTGSGLISANGGRSIYNAGGGGGGRVAVYYSDASGFNLATQIYNKGGLGHSNGPAGTDGTIYLKNRNDPVFVIQSTPTGNLTTDINELTVRFSAEIDPTTFTIADIVLTGPSGVISIASITKVDAINYTLGLAAPLTTSGDYTLEVGPNVLTVQGNGMDQDRDTIINEVPDDVYSATFTIDKNPPTIPVITSHPVSPEVTTVTTSSVTFTGTREADTSIWINGTQRVVSGPANWSVDLSLVQGQQDLVIHAEDAAGNKSGTVTVTILVDSIAPTITLGTNAPASGASINTVPNISLKVTETGSGIDIPNSTLTVTRNGQGVAGTWAEVAGELVFTPGIVLIDGQYIITAQLKDKAGLTSALFSTQFTYDNTPPAAPVVGNIPSVVNINSVTISGTKEAYTGIYSNADNVVAYSTQTTWSFDATDLTEGDNTFVITAKDKAGNTSTDVIVTVKYDNTAPAAVTATAATGANGTSIKVDWTGYDEFTNGNDIDHYSIYVETTPFTSITGLTAKATVAGGTFNGIVTGLTRNITYNVAVVAFDSSQNNTTAVTTIPVLTKDTVAPEEVSNITFNVTGDAVNVNWTASVNTAADLANYKLYFNNDAGTLLASTVTNKLVIGLTAATAYPVKVTAIDNDGNESAGITATAVTILENPTGLAVTPFSGKVELTWNAATDPALVKDYVIYAETTDFTNVDLLTPKLIVNKGITTKQLAGLTNDIPYFFAVTAINTSGGENKAVTTVTATPTPDTIGPELTNIQFGAAPLVDNLNITQSGNITLSASDQSGMSRVEFQLDGVSFKTDANGSANYSALLDIINTTDAAHTITINAYDTLENVTTVTVPVTVALAAPAAPSITAPAANLTTNKRTVTVSGTAEKQTEVQLYNNNVAVGSLLTVSSSGIFTSSFIINEGDNSLTATAKNRGGEGSQSPPVVITLDATIPDAPVGLSATAKASGQIQLSWNAVQDTNVAGVDLYRSTQAFTDAATATKVNTSLITSNRFTDLPPADGLYFYSLIAVNKVLTASDLSTQVSANADNTAPHAVTIEYTTAGNYDPVTKRMAPGIVSVVLTVNETLLTTPFLSIAPNGGIPISVNLTRFTDTEYKGSFTIKDITPSGTAYAVFSARDAVGNRGTEVLAGNSIEIDAQGPNVDLVVIAPGEPVKTDSTTPETINFEINLSEAAAEIPSMSYQLSGAGRLAVTTGTLNQVQQTNKWVGSFILPTDAGQTEVENLSFIYSGIDDLGNISARINGDNSFQVYQGDLPPLAVPTGLKANAVPGGSINIEWNAVEGAAEYALFRQAPGETALTEYKRVTGLTTADTTTVDGNYSYTITSVRKANNQEGLSAQSTVVTVSSDSSVPTAPQTLALELVGNGIKATWLAPVGNTELLTYSLYRANLTQGNDITDVSTLTPIATGITELTTIDGTPSDTDHTYAVVAVDAAGNQSPPSASVYLNFDLLPVATLDVTQINQDAPVISWTHGGSTIAGYDLYLESLNTLKLNGSILLTTTNYVDSGYSGDARTYTVKAVDVNAVESIGRTITLPKLSATLKATSQLNRGVMNQLDFDVANNGTVAVNNIKLNIEVNAIPHNSASFNLAAGEVKSISVVVGGYQNLPDISLLKTSIEVTPNAGEKVSIIRTQDITVGNGALVLGVTTETLTRGSTGRVQFTLENTSAVETDIILATSSGANASNELRFKLLDVDNNVLSTQAIKQQVGSDLIRTLANGTTVARIPAGAIFTSAWVDLPVPANAPQDVWVEFAIDKLHHHVGQADHVEIAGLTNKRATTLIDTTYYGQLTSISPQSSYGDQDIIIQGKAIERSTTADMPSVPLKLVITANGFERSYNIYTDTAGLFSHTFTPLSGESGNYKVSIIHPDVLDRPQNGTFTINRVTVSPTTLNVTTSRNYDQTLSVNASTGPGSTASNIRLVYETADQAGGVLPTGVTVTLGAAKNLTASQSTSLGLTLRADDTADATGNLKLKVLSDESGAVPLALVTVNYTFSQAVPVLNFSPGYIDTGVSQGNTISETISLSNSGLADLENVNVTLQNTDGSPAPSWLYLTVPQAQGTIAIGEKRGINFVAAPTTALADGNYNYKLHITSSNHAARDVNIFVAVTQSGIGEVLFKASDIYTLTKDVNGNFIQGLVGAKLYLQNERVLSEEFTQYTDVNGETIFSNLPSGWYKYRATANNHQEVLGRVQIKAGVTASTEVFLDYNLVTVEWSVTEITLQDKYSITLNATYETEVPAAVVVSQPSSIELPTMAAGEVFYGEFTLTNYGLIRADNLTVTLPTTDQYIRYEIMGGIPDNLAAKEKIVVPFRAVALKAFDPSVAPNGTGGGCYTYTGPINVGFDYICANGTIADGTTGTTMTYTYGSCSVSGGGSAGGGTSGGTGSITFVGGSGTVSNFTPTYESLSGQQCVPRPGCESGNCCGGPAK